MSYQDALLLRDPLKMRVSDKLSAAPMTVRDSIEGICVLITGP